MSFLFLVVIGNRVFSQVKTTQDDTVLAPNVAPVPLVDGKGDDKCWQSVPWQSIGQVWIPYGEHVDPGDYSGRYKVVWSSTPNLLYFLIEVHDDKFVDGYVPGVTADIYNFDIVEVFIDEDASGGPHVFDGAGETGREWGTNAANAFAYHIYAAFPREDSVTTEHYVGDIGGTSWADVKAYDFASHFPDFALRKAGYTAVWEFSLIVYNDTYMEDNRSAARAKLMSGKVMGLSVAYCDNDNPNENPKTRDNFYGSVWVPAGAYNGHWMNADYFGKVKLVWDIPSGVGGGHDAPDETINLRPIRLP
jgi:hypothetical protein